MIPISQIVVLSQPEFVRRQVQQVLFGRRPEAWRGGAAE